MTIRTSFNFRDAHGLYEGLEGVEGEELARDELGEAGDAIAAINEAWCGIESAFKAHGFQASNSDAAEEVVALLTEYLLESNKGNAPLQHVRLLAEAKAMS
jgi:hypothetical protein